MLHKSGREGKCQNRKYSTKLQAWEMHVQKKRKTNNMEHRMSSNNLRELNNAAKDAIRDTILHFFTLLIQGRLPAGCQGLLGQGIGSV